VEVTQEKKGNHHLLYGGGRIRPPFLGGKRRRGPSTLDFGHLPSFVGGEVAEKAFASDEESMKKKGEHAILTCLLSRGGKERERSGTDILV